MSDTTPAYQPQTQIFKRVCGMFWMLSRLDGYAFWLCCALSLKAFLLFSCHALIEPNISLSHCAVLCLCASYACCCNVCFSFSLFVGVLTIGVLVFLFRPGTQCKCQQVGDLELRESISLSGWNLIFVARLLAENINYCCGFKCHFQPWIGTWLQNQVETLISLSNVVLLQCMSLRLTSL